MSLALAVADDVDALTAEAGVLDDVPDGFAPVEKVVDDVVAPVDEIAHLVIEFIELVADFGEFAECLVVAQVVWCKKDVFRRQLDKTNPEPTPVPYDPFAGKNSERKMRAGWFEATQNFGCLPRDTDFVRKELKRAATPDELAAVAAKFDAVKKSERTNVLGKFYGPEYEYTVREAVLELPDGVNAMSVEYELRRMGIEADNCGPGVVAVRIG